MQPGIPTSRDYSCDMPFTTEAAAGSRGAGRCPGLRLRSPLGWLVIQGTAAERTPAGSLTVLGARIFRLTSTAKERAGGSLELSTESIRADREWGACDRFSLPGDGFSVAGLGSLPKRVFRAIPPQYAAMPAEVPERSLALHPTTTSSCLASAGRARRDSSRLCSRIRAMAWRRFARYSSRVLACPLAPGTSAQ